MLPAGYRPVCRWALFDTPVVDLEAQQREDAGGQNDEQQQAEGQRGRGAHATTIPARRYLDGRETDTGTLTPGPFEPSPRGRTVT